MDTLSRITADQRIWMRRLSAGLPMARGVAPGSAICFPPT
jgi:hypothetical protein